MDESVVEKIDGGFAARARERQSRLTKPPGSLGRLEEIAVRLAAIQRSERPVTRGRTIVLFAGDHGVTEEGVSPYPSEVTGQMVANITSGGAAINAIAGVAKAEVRVVDTRSVRASTRNLAREPAMTEAEVEEAMRLGTEAVGGLESVTVVGLGEMGIGNTTAASAMTAALTGLSPARVTGRGTGLGDDGVRRKVAVVERALDLHGVCEPHDILRCLGGLEIAALTGFCLEAARRRKAIVVDGFITTAAFAIAWRIEPLVKDYAFFSHRSVEPGHESLLEFLDAEPLLDLHLRLGEGTGAALAIPILDAAVAAHNEMATFESAGVADKT